MFMGVGHIVLLRLSMDFLRMEGGDEFLAGIAKEVRVSPSGNIGIETPMKRLKPNKFLVDYIKNRSQI